MAKANPAAPIRVIEETPAYWRVVFDYPPFNILDATIFGGLQDLLLRMDASQRLRVVVFESAIPDFCRQDGYGHAATLGQRKSVAHMPTAATTTADSCSMMGLRDRNGRASN